MTDVLIVTDPNGQKLDELPCDVERSWRLERTVDVARGSLSIPANHSKALYKNLRAGNYVFVYSSDYPTIPNWAGAIWLSEPNGIQLQNGNLVIPVRSTEWILHKRPTDPICTLTGTPGDKFKQVLAQALKGGFLPISMDYRNVNASNGTAEDETVHLAYCYETANDLANNNEAYWYFEPSIDERNALIFQPVFKFKQSSVFPRLLTVGGDPTRINLVVKSIGIFKDIANRITGVGHFDDWGNPVLYTEDNEASKARYNQIYWDKLECPEVTTVEGLVAPVRAELKRRAFEQLWIDGVVTSAPYPRIGDICKVEMNDNGQYLSANRGSVVTMQADSIIYSPQTSALKVHLTEVIQ